MKYYCIHCKKEVEPIEGTFLHPDLGRREGLLCPYCKKPIMVKEE